MPIQVEIKLPKDLIKRIQGIGKKALKGMQKGIMFAGYEVQKEAKNLIRRSPPDHSKKRSISKNGVKKSRRRYHSPSFPGNAPRSDTGGSGLFGHIFVKTPDPVTALVVAETNYSAALEGGTKKMAARPFLKPALEKKRDTIDKIVAEEIERAIER